MVSENELISDAASGDRDAQFRLGRMYRDGISVEQDVTKAIKWFTCASDNGHIRAKYELAVLLESQNNKNDNQLILELLQDAANYDDTDALLKLARAYRDGLFSDKDVDLAIHLYRKSVDKGSSRAKLELAELLYKSGKYIDHLECIKCCYELAENGDKDAMFRLYLCYRYAIGTKSDNGIARYWLQKAADAGHKAAKREVLVFE